MNDEIIQEVWQIKNTIGKEVNYNLHALGALLQKRQYSGKKRIVDLSSKRKTVKKKFSSIYAAEVS